MSSCRHAILGISSDPTFNLALEEYLYQSLGPESQSLFFLWQNGPSVIVGRHQNTAEEVNTAFAEENNIAVVRRMTGGGAVYHDAGNLNFSFLEWREHSGPINFLEYLEPIRDALRDIGIEATFSSRNDLEVDGKKISGSAQVRHGHRVLHHGTLLIDVNADMLSSVLTGSPEKYASKGIASMRARVTNMVEHWREGCTMADVHRVLMEHCASQTIAIPQEYIDAAEELAQKKYRTWEWNYGHGPAFTHSFAQRFSWGKLECRLDVRKGLIKNCHLCGDFFAQNAIEELSSKFVGREHRREAVRALLESVDLPLYFAACQSSEVVDFFTSNFPA